MFVVWWFFCVCLDWLLLVCPCVDRRWLAATIEYIAGVTEADTTSTQASRLPNYEKKATEGPQTERQSAGCLVNREVLELSGHRLLKVKI